jgi:DNA-binding response OmpR family regulator
MLESQGYVVLRASNGKQAVAQVKESSPALAVIDPGSLRINGARLSHMLRRADGSVPIIWVLDEGRLVSKDGIADLSLERPFTKRKLINRVRKLLPATETESLAARDFVFDVEARVVKKGDRKQRLTPKQAMLLEELMRHAPDVLSRRFLMKTVWNTDYLGDTRTLDVHIRWVREAIEDDPSSPEYILTVRGVGYRFEPSNREAPPEPR